MSSSSFPLLAPNGTAAAPSYSFGGGTGGAGTGLYAAGVNILGFATAGLTAGNIGATQLWTIGASATTGFHTFNGQMNMVCSQAATSTFELDNLSSNASAQSAILAVVGDATTSSKKAYHSSRNRDTQNIQWYWGTLGDDLFTINTSIATGGFLSITSAGLLTLGNGTATQHALNTLLATNGAQNATLTNLPAAATAGNPNGWLKITINGTTSYIPFWH